MGVLVRKKNIHLHLAGLSARSLEEIWEEIKLRSVWKRVKSEKDESGLKTNMSSAYMIRLDSEIRYSIDVDKKEEGTEDGSLRNPRRRER